MAQARMAIQGTSILSICPRIKYREKGRGLNDINKEGPFQMHWNGSALYYAVCEIWELDVL